MDGPRAGGVALSRRPELVIFDCDGVLVDSEPLSNAVLAEMLAEEGLRLTVAESRSRYQGLLLREIAERVGAELGRALPEDWLDRYQRRRDEAFRDGPVQPVPGARRLVRDVLDAGLPVCVASQGRLAKVALTLSLTGLDQLFPVAARFSSEQVARGKPHPDLFLHAARTIGVAPQRCAVVEDSPSGVTAAIAAGMTAYGYAADSDAQALRAAGAQVVMTLQELRPLLLTDVGSGKG